MPRAEKSESRGEFSCGTCAFYSSAEECRRFPPQPVVLTTKERGQRIEYRWPHMESDDWCGEFQRRRKSE